jgi:hypothetical protein
MNDADHDRFRELLGEYLAETLPDDERLSVDAHLSSCDECAARLDVLAGPPPPPPGLKDRVLQRVRAGGGLSQALAGAAVVMVLGIIGFVIADLENVPQRRLFGAATEAVVVDVDDAPLAVLARRIPKDDPLVAPIDEPAIFSPEAKPMDHNESADSYAFSKPFQGDSTDFLSYIKGEAGGYRGRLGGKGTHVYDTMGVGLGGGGGGPYGGRIGNRDAVTPYFLPDQEVAAARFGGASRKREPDRVVPVAARQAAPAQDEAPPQARKLIRSGELEFEIDSFDGSVGTLTKIAVEEQGFVATINSEKLANGKVRGTVVVRVPPERLDTLLLKLRALGDLKSQRIGSADVTKQYTDLESRLRAARTMEERLLKIIKDGKGEIKDLLQAEKELGEWRTRIETMVGEINYYNNLIAHSTLTITLTEREIRAPHALVETERVEMGL